jgi:2-iminoacetate synthase
MLDPDKRFFDKLVRDNISGQLKVAPEHISGRVLEIMGKSKNNIYEQFCGEYFDLCIKHKKEQYLVPYLMSSHPGSTLEDAVNLAVYLKARKYSPEQVQDFYPTPGTASACMFYTGIDPFSGRRVYVPASYAEKREQRALLQSGKPENREIVKKALKKDSDSLSFYDYGALLSPAGEDLLEDMARRSKLETRKHFGNSVSLYTPLYISNHCDNHCTYCGFNCENKINRGKLSLDEIDGELKAIAATGLEEILLLTGESRKKSDIQYIGDAVKLAVQYFSTVGIEIYPLNTDEYAYLNQCGADFVSIYQETYDIDIYAKYHLSGPKRVYSYRFHAQERASKGGMRGVSFGALLGLADFRKDAFATGVHAYYLQQKYPHTEISFSVPRIRAYINNPGGSGISSQILRIVREKQLLQVLFAYKIFMPFASISISTRERAGFRDNIIGLAANKISAGVKVGVGGHGAEQKGDEQFEISDARTVAEIHAAIVNRGLQPVYTDYIRL